MPTSVNGVGAALSLRASTKLHSNPNGNPFAFSHNATSPRFGAGSSRAHIVWGVFSRLGLQEEAIWPGTAACQPRGSPAQHPSAKRPRLAASTMGRPRAQPCPSSAPGTGHRGMGVGSSPPLCMVPSEMGWAGGTRLGCLGFGVAVVLCYACSAAVLAADANLVPSPKCPAEGTRIDVVVPQPLSPVPPRCAVLMCGTSVAPPGF